jgi:hypothetical protein
VWSSIDGVSRNRMSLQACGLQRVTEAATGRAYLRMGLDYGEGEGG